MNKHIDETQRSIGEWLPCFNEDIFEFKRELNSFIDGAFMSDKPAVMDEKLSAYSGDLVWFRDEKPAAGGEYSVLVWRPFSEEAGSCFRAAYIENSTSHWKILECTALKAACPEDAEIPAEALIRVKAIYEAPELMVKSDPNAAHAPEVRLAQAELFGSYDLVYWKWLDDGTRVVSAEVEGDGRNREEILDEAVIFTDEAGTDHLIAARHNGNVRFGDVPLGSHSLRKAMLCQMSLNNSMVQTDEWICGEGIAEINVIWGETGYGSSDLVLVSASMKGKSIDLGSMFEDGGDDAWYCIGDDAFVSGDTEEIMLTACIQTIGENAFSRCPLLRKVTVPDGCMLWPESIAPNAFMGCSKEITFSVPKASPLIQRLELMGHRVTERE